MSAATIDPTPGSAAPVAPAVHTDNGSELRQIKEAIIETRDGLRAVAAEREELAKTRTDLMAELHETHAKLNEMERRVDFLDKIRPRGAKGDYTTLIDNSHDTAVRSVGNFFALAQVRANQEPIPKFLKDLNDAYIRAQAEGGTGSTGGGFVPEEIWAGCERIIRERSIGRQYCRYVKMNSDSMVINSITVEPVAEFLSQGVVPTQDADITFQTEANARTTAETLVLWGVVSRELNADALAAFGMVQAEVFGERMARKENEACFNMSAPFTGALQAATNVYTFSATTLLSDLDYDDFNAGYHLLDGDVIGGDDLAWVMHPKTFQWIANIKSVTGGFPLFMATQGGGSTKFDGAKPSIANRPGGVTIFGAPVIFSSTMPTHATGQAATKYFFVGDLKGIFFLDRQMIEIEVDDSVLRKTRQRALLMTERFAVKVPMGAKFTAFKTT